MNHTGKFRYNGAELALMKRLAGTEDPIRAIEAFVDQAVGLGKDPNEHLKEVKMQAEAESLSKGAFQVEDVTKDVLPYLSKAGEAAINSRKVTNLMDTDYQVRFIATQNGPKRLAEIINEYAEAFQVVGVLAHPLKLDLVPDLSGPRALYACYLAYTPAAARIIDKLISYEKHTGFIKEGEMPDA